MKANDAGDEDISSFKILEGAGDVVDAYADGLIREVC